MSDADEMDVDAAGAPDTSDAMTFRAQGNLKGKARSGAANLPVEAEDNLPWSVASGFPTSPRLL